MATNREWPVVAMVIIRKTAVLDLAIKLARGDMRVGMHKLGGQLLT